MTLSPKPDRVVLVVEDDPILRLSAIDIVEDAGCAFLEAANADEAIELLNAHSGIDVLFTDVDMPGSMDGLALAHAVRARWPKMSIVVVSGHLKVAATDMPPNGAFFPKPYTASEIRRAITTRPSAN